MRHREPATPRRLLTAHPLSSGPRNLSVGGGASAYSRQLSRTITRDPNVRLSGRSISLTASFTTPTIASLEEHVEDRGADAATAEKWSAYYRQAAATVEA